MFRFLFKCTFILIIFFVGVILGMQKANTGLLNMRGFDDPKLYNAVSFENDNGEVNAEILGNEVNSHDLQKKKEKLQEMKAFNMFSSLGKKATEGVTSLFNKVIDLIVPE